MVTPKMGKAMAQATTRHNSGRAKKLVVFYKALKIISTAEAGWKVQTVFDGTIGGKQAQVVLLNDDKITLNLTVEGTTFEPLAITETINENDYLAWNLRVRKQMAKPQEPTVPAPTPTLRANKIVNSKAINQKAKAHIVTPLDHNTFSVKSGTSGEDYLVRLLIDLDGATCTCGWGEKRKYIDYYRSACSHTQAVYQQAETHRGRTTSAWATKEDAKRQHRPIADIGDGVFLTLRKK